MNYASVIGGLPKGEPGSLLYRHPVYDLRWYMRELGRVSYLGGSEYLNPTSLSADFFDAELEIDPTTGLSKVAKYTRQVYKSLLYRHSREKHNEFLNRNKRAYYNNFVRTSVNAIVSHAMKKEVDRKGDELLTKFWSGVDYKRKRDIGAFVRTGLRWAQVEGLMWACVDAPRDAGGIPYVYWVSPLDVFDWEVDGEGELVWLKQFAVASKTRTWKEKFEQRFRFRIWTRAGVTTYETDAKGGGQVVVADQTHAYQHGRVPWIPIYSVRDEDDNFENATPLAGDLCKSANHVFNLGSLLSEIGYKQTFSWLTVPDKRVDVLQAGLNTAFGYDPGTGGGKPEYISPDAEQARVLMEMIRDGIEQARQAFGVGRGRSEGSMEKSSGEALALESEDKRSILADVATEAQDFEVRLSEMVQAYKNPRAAKPGDGKTSIRYSMDFDMRSFKAEVDDALSLSKLKLSDEVSVELVQDLVRKRFSGMDAAALKKLTDSIRTKFEEDAKAAEEMRQKMVAGGGDGGPGGQGPGGDAGGRRPMPPGQMDDAEDDAEDDADQAA